MPTQIPPADTPDNESILLAKRLADVNAYEILLIAKDINQDGRLSKKESLAAFGDTLALTVDNAITQLLEQQASKPSPLPNPCKTATYSMSPATAAMLHKTAALAMHPTMLLVANDVVYNKDWIAGANTSKSFGYGDALGAIARAFPKGVEAVTIADVLSISPAYQAIPSGDKLIVMKRCGPTI